MDQEQPQLAQEGYATDDTMAEGPEQTPGFVIPHADRVITVHGVTGAIGNLINLCPVPAEDKALWSQGQVDAFVEQLISMDEVEKVEEEPAEVEDAESEKPKKKLS